MAEVQPPLFVDIDSAYAADALGIAHRDLFSEGIVASGDLALSAPGGMKVRVAKGSCWVVGDDNTDLQPTYRCFNDGNVDVTITPSDPANPRVDRIIARVYDAGFAGATRKWQLEALAGAPTVGATLTNLSGAAAIPNNALLLANTLVPAAAAAIVGGNIGDVRARALIGGGGVKLSPTVTKVSKLTAKTWNTSAGESTDMLNSEISLPAGLSASADWILDLFMEILNNTGGNVTWTWRFKLGAGPTTIWVPTTVSISPSAARRAMHLVIKGANLGAINAQEWSLDFGHPASTAGAVFVTGEGEEMDSWGNPVAGLAATALDTSVAQPIVVTAQHSSASANAESKLLAAILKVY